MQKNHVTCITILFPLCNPSPTKPSAGFLLSFLCLSFHVDQVGYIILNLQVVDQQTCMHHLMPYSSSCCSSCGGGIQLLDMILCCDAAAGPLRMMLRSEVSSIYTER